MDISKLILSDEAVNAIDNGVWVGDLIGAPGLELLVTGISGAEAQKVLKSKQAKLRLENGGVALSDEQNADVMREVLAEQVLRGWRGLTDGDKPVAYSADLARGWLVSRNGQAFAGLVLQAAQRVDSNANELVRVVVKN